jgi:hypothetical protein
MRVFYLERWEWRSIVVLHDCQSQLCNDMQNAAMVGSDLPLTDFFKDRYGNGPPQLHVLNDTQLQCWSDTMKTSVRSHGKPKQFHDGPARAKQCNRRIFAPL